MPHFLLSLWLSFPWSVTQPEKQIPRGLSLNLSFNDSGPQKQIDSRNGFLESGRETNISKIYLQVNY